MHGVRLGAVAEDHFEAEDGRLGQAPAVVAGLALPLFAPDLAHPAQVLVARVALDFGRGAPRWPMAS